MQTMLTEKWTKLVVPVVCLTLLLSTMALMSSPAHAAVSTPHITCHGPSCDHQAPNGTGCWNAHAYIVLSGYINKASQQGIVDLWYSSDCQTNWVNVRSIVGCGSITNEVAIVSRTGGKDGSTETYAGYGMQSDCTNHTAMVWAPDVPTGGTGVIFKGELGSWTGYVHQ